MQDTIKFTADNFKSGFLIDEELLAGISETPDSPGVFTAYVVRHTTGETLGSQQYTNVFEAIRTINNIERHWSFESTSKCGGNCASGSCGKSGSCKTKVAREQAACESASSCSSATSACSGEETSA
jgi:hypothetical protein